MSSQPDIQPQGPAEDRRRSEASLRRSVREHLRGMVLDRWFPLCIDQERGGFHQSFGRDWTRKPDTRRSLVYQARMTWVAAEAARAFPDEQHGYVTIARHGIEGLARHLHDPEAGGYFFSRDLSAAPSEGQTDKHAYGIAFVIYAGATTRATAGSQRAMDMAVDAFRWLDEHAWDTDHGGCQEALTRSGEPIRGGGPQADGRFPTDLIGTPMGYKSMNTHIHLLEAFAALFKVWPDARLRERIEELQSILTDKMGSAPGCLHALFTPDWEPVPGCVSYGHDVEAGFLLVESMRVLGRPDDAEAWRCARALVDHALAYGWDEEHGGFYDAGEGAGVVRDDTKTWWVQAEGLNALCLMHQRFGEETDRYFKALLHQWAFIEGHQVDPEYGGWYGYLSPDGARRRDDGDKAHEWKTAYHNARALMNVVKFLEPGAGR